MKHNVLLTITAVLLTMLTFSCAPKRDVLNASTFRSATTPAGSKCPKTSAECPKTKAECAKTSAECAKTKAECAKNTLADATVSTENEIPAVPEELTSITEEDIARFEKELSEIMGEDYVAAEKPKKEEKAPAQVEAPAAEASFYVIVGAFSSAEKAEAQKNALQTEGSNSGIIETENGLFRVYAFSSNDKAAAQKELAIIRDFYPSAWLLKK
jgi:cell division protein FtsN